MRRIIFALPALALACATNSASQQKSGTRQAQDDAQQQYQNAANAQKRATEAQQKAEQAERDVTKAQKGLADAQARLVGERAKAEQAQSDALQMGRDSQRRGALLQDQATPANLAGALPATQSRVNHHDRPDEDVLHLDRHIAITHAVLQHAGRPPVGGEARRTADHEQNCRAEPGRGTNGRSCCHVILDAYCGSVSRILKV